MADAQAGLVQVSRKAYLHLHITPELSFIASNVVQDDFSISTDVNFLS